MKCPGCGSLKSNVVDSRSAQEGSAIRRRRECVSCKKRFTTFEMIESVPVFVIKKDGSRELFDRAKVLSGIMKATEKRPVNAEELTNQIEAEIQNSLRQDVPTREIGEMIMRALKERDDVAYVRFASVYREFKDIDTFLHELNELRAADSAENTAGKSSRE
ncbi:MAG: transcriptional repressor NrdR [Clostridia bacterium]|nr:transcriptional repressor NrdR [Clostridia bacterium]